MPNILQLYFLIFSLLFLFNSKIIMAETAKLSMADCAKMRAAGVISFANPLPCERLRRVKFNYINFDGVLSVGNIIVIDAAAQHTEKIFIELLSQHFTLHKAVPMENYHGNDEASMADNNTSSFNGRNIAGSNQWSKHALGAAIDINPVQNPIIIFNSDKPQILPAAGAAFFYNRNNLFIKNKNTMAETVVKIFRRHGFLIWGGAWKNPIDYQHFEIGSGKFINKLISQSPATATKTFNTYVRNYSQCLDNNKELADKEKHSVCFEKVNK